jgi:GDP-L-fucose synthase
MQRNSKIYVAGGDTLIGAAIIRRLQHHGYTDLCNRTEAEVDLTTAPDVRAYFQRVRPEYVFFAAGRSGGIRANMNFPADLIQDNLLSSIHVVDSAHRHGVRKLLYLASSCSYPKLCPQPMRVADLMSGAVEPTNEAYAMAKLAGIKLCQAYRRQYGDDFIVGIPANAFGPGDDFSLENSHVVAALIRKMHEAVRRDDDRVEVWGTGSARREFIFADDLADACIHVMLNYCHEEPINLGGGLALSIGELARIIRRVVGFTGRLEFDPSKPDGMPMKGLESSRLEGLGWRPRVGFEDALSITYQWYLDHELQSTDPRKGIHALV